MASTTASTEQKSGARTFGVMEQVPEVKTIA